MTELSSRALPRRSRCRRSSEEHWRFTDLAGFDPEAWAAGGATDVAAAAALLEIDAAALARAGERGLTIERAPEGVRFEPLTDDHPLLGLARPGGRQVPRPQRGAVGARAPRPRAAPASTSTSRSTSASSNTSRRWLALLARARRRRAGQPVHADRGARLRERQSSPGTRTQPSRSSSATRRRSSTSTCRTSRVARWLFASCHATGRARRGAGLGRRRLRLGEGQGADPERPRRAAVRPRASPARTSPTGRSTSTTTRTSCIMAPDTTSDFAFKGALRDTAPRSGAG